MEKLLALMAQSGWFEMVFNHTLQTNKDFEDVEQTIQDILKHGRSNGIIAVAVTMVLVTLILSYLEVSPLEKEVIAKILSQADKKELELIRAFVYHCGGKEYTGNAESKSTLLN
jgi:hypothetical protein